MYAQISRIGRNILVVIFSLRPHRFFSYYLAAFRKLLSLGHFAGCSLSLLFHSLFLSLCSARLSMQCAKSAGYSTSCQYPVLVVPNSENSVIFRTLKYVCACTHIHTCMCTVAYTKMHLCIGTRRRKWFEIKAENGIDKTRKLWRDVNLWIYLTSAARRF